MESIKEIMSLEHPKWNDFITRLKGKDACNFRLNKEQIINWNCENNFQFSITILESMENIDIAGSLDFFQENGGYCDCEIVFNVSGEIDLLR